MTWLGMLDKKRTGFFVISSLALVIAVLALPACGSNNDDELGVAASEQVDQYIRLMGRCFTEQYESSVRLQQLANNFLRETSNQRLELLREGLKDSQVKFAQTLVTKNYPSPYNLTASITESGSHALARMSSWPLDPAYLEDKKSGLINSPRYQINPDNLRSLHAGRRSGEATLGLSVLEVLLWAPRLDSDAQSIQSVMPTRKITDFSPGSWINERRRRYLKVAVDQLVADATYMRDAWVTNKEAAVKDGNFATKFASRSDKEVLRDVFNGLVGLLEQDIIRRGLAVPLETRTPQWLPAAFSSNTLSVLQAELQAIADVYEGTDVAVGGLRSLVAQRDQTSADRVSIQLKLAQQALANLREPLAGLVGADRSSAASKMMGVSLAALEELAEALRSAATAMKLTLKTPEEMARVL